MMATIVFKMASCWPFLMAWAQQDNKQSSAVDAVTVKSMLDSSIHFASKAKELLQAGNCLSDPKDCEDALRCGQKKSGPYRIDPASRLDYRCLEVFCDMETDGGGWTVIQRRGDFGRAKDYFHKDWEAYKHGFGDVSQDFWIGNNALFSLTNQKPYALRFDLKDLDGNRKYAVYDNFWIDSEDYNFSLHVTGYSGDAGDSFSGHTGSKFSTKDRDNDNHESHCAATYKGGWWYNQCHTSNLNGLYLNGSHASFADGVDWKAWLGYNYSLPVTEMKIRRTFFKEKKALKGLHELTPR